MRSILALVLALSPAAVAQEVRYRVLLGGNPAGAQVTLPQPDGELRFSFEFNDRGRGPKLESRMRLAADGTPAFEETSGNDYLKKPVAERFSVEGGKAGWTNQGEEGDRAVAGPAFYVSFWGVPEELGLLARALLKAPGGSLALLPEGEARIEKVGDQDVRAGERSQHVTQYAITGLDFSPTSVWLDADGRYFFSGSSWYSVVREGWEDAVPSLLDAQDKAAAGLMVVDGEFAAATPELMARAADYREALEAALDFTKPKFNEEMRSGHANM